MKSRKICMLGGTGFVGRHLAAELSERGYDIKVLTHNRERHRELLVLPTLNLRNADIHDPDTLHREFEDMDVVINLVGILNGRDNRGHDFRRVHVELPRKVAEACKKKGVRQVLHMSALGADPGHAPSHYLRSKGEGEGQYHLHGGASLRTTIFRPSVIFGPGDSFVNRFARLLRLTPFVFPLACPDSRYAPVYVGDVVQAFADSIDDPHVAGERFELCGPDEYTLRQIVEYVRDTLGLRRRVIGLPPVLSRLQGRVMQHLPGKPFTMDNYLSASVPNVCNGAGALERFVDYPTPMEAVVPTYLLRRGVRWRYREYRRMPRLRHTAIDYRGRHSGEDVDRESGGGTRRAY